jgi:hypothetical protein
MKPLTTVMLACGFVGITASIAVRASPQQSQAVKAVGPDVQAADDEETLDTLQARIDRGFEIAPVPLNLEGKDRNLVGLGSYLVNATGACNDCHTNPSYVEGHDPFLGQSEKINKARYLAGGTAFGPFVSRNLTPRANGLPANLTFEQFRIVIRRGYDLKGREPFVPSKSADRLQVMPWPVYSHMRLADLRAIYEYLRAIPSLPSTPTP